MPTIASKIPHAIVISPNSGELDLLGVGAVEITVSATFVCISRCLVEPGKILSVRGIWLCDWSFHPPPTAPMKAPTLFYYPSTVLALFIVLTRVAISIGTTVVRTIDDTHGDSESGVLPVYEPANAFSLVSLYFSERDPTLQKHFSEL